MLSPAISGTKDLLTLALNEIQRLDRHSTTVNNIVIGRLLIDPDWLSSVRSRTAMLGSAGAAWIQDKPDLWGSVLLQFTDYASAFSGVADMQKRGLISSKEQWVNLLNDVLLRQLGKAVAATTAADTRIQAHYQKLTDVRPLLEASINEGRAARDDQEQQMIRIAEQLEHLQHAVESLAEFFLSIRDVVPQIARLWSTEKNKVRSVIEALQGGVSPDDHFEVLSLSTAAANWQVINEFASSIPGLKSLGLAPSQS
jgi:hypothetical protein